MKRVIHDVPDEYKHGDCFKVAYDTFMEDPDRYTLVHGIVTGQGPIEGIQYCHAWVLDGDEVIDNTVRGGITMPKAIYYAIGQIEDTQEYTLDEVLSNTVKTGHYGPWYKPYNAYCP